MGKIVKRFHFFVGLYAFGAEAVCMLNVLLIELSQTIFIHFNPFSSNFNLLPPFSSTFAYFHPLHPFHPRSSIFFHFHLFSLIFIHFHPLQPFLSTFIHFHPFSSIFIHFHPVSIYPWLTKPLFNFFSRTTPRIISYTSVTYTKVHG